MPGIGRNHMDGGESPETRGMTQETGGETTAATREAALAEAEECGGFGDSETSGPGGEAPSPEKGASRSEAGEDGRFENAAYRQGENDYGYQGTCGPASSANAVNLVTGRHDCSENQAVHTAVEKDLCLRSDNPEMAGGTSTRDVEILVQDLAQPEDNIHTEVYEKESALTVEQLAGRVEEEGTVAIVGVDAAALWDESGGVAGSGLFQMDGPSDHWITVESPSYDSAGNLNGFHIVDSGGGESFVSLEKFERCYQGDENHTVTDPTVIIVTDHEES